MAKYEKKMMQFEAFQYKGGLIGSNGKHYVPKWAQEAYKKGILSYQGFPKEGAFPRELYTRHPDGEKVHIPVGYYIIRWSDIELYPCEPNLFEASYIPVGEESEEKRCLNTQDRHWLCEEKNQELKEAVKPLHEWICKYGDPYVAVIVKQCGVQVFEGAASFPLPVPD